MLLTLIAILGSAGRTWGFVAAGPNPSLATHTLEALTIDSPLIMTARVCPPTPGSAGITIEPIEVLKSPAPLTVSSMEVFCEPWYRPDRPLPGTKLLLFLARNYFRGPGTWLIYDFVPLDAPLDARSLHSPVIRDLTLKPIGDARQALAVVRMELQRTPPTAATEHFQVYPFDLANLPSDNRLLPAARLWADSAEPLARYLAVRVLAKHRDPADVPLLYARLGDPFSVDYPWLLSPWSAHEYVIRQAAAQELAARGLSVPAVTLFVPRSNIYKPLALTWLGLAVLVPLVVTPVVYGIGMVCLLRWRVRLRRMVGATLHAVCLGLAILLVVLWWRSYSTADDVVYAQHGRLMDVQSIWGYVVLETTKPWPGECRLVHVAVTPSKSDPPEQRSLSFRNNFTVNESSLWSMYIQWYFPPAGWLAGVNPKHRVLRFPFNRAGASAFQPGFLGAIYYGYLVILCLLLPIWRFLLIPGVRLAWRVPAGIRSRRRARAGLCHHCGYDLRAHKPGDRCPECGTPIHSGPATS